MVFRTSLMEGEENGRLSSPTVNRWECCASQKCFHSSIEVPSPPFHSPRKTADMQSPSLIVSAAQLSRRTNTVLTASDVSVRALIRKQETLRHGIGISEWTNLRTFNCTFLWTPRKAASSPFPEESIPLACRHCRHRERQEPHKGMLVLRSASTSLISSRLTESGQAQPKLGNPRPSPGRNILYPPRMVRFGNTHYRAAGHLTSRSILRISWGNGTSISVAHLSNPINTAPPTYFIWFLE